MDRLSECGPRLAQPEHEWTIEDAAVRQRVENLATLLRSEPSNLISNGAAVLDRCKTRNRARYVQ